MATPSPAIFISYRTIEGADKATARGMTWRRGGA
jgi:hypothetical protein